MDGDGILMEDGSWETWEAEESRARHTQGTELGVMGASRGRGASVFRDLTRGEQECAWREGYHQVVTDEVENADEVQCTHFVSIPLDNVSVLHRIATVQEAIIEAEPALRPGMIDRRCLHLTLAVMNVEPAALHHIKRSFSEEVQNILDQAFVASTPVLTLQGLG